MAKSSGIVGRRYLERGEPVTVLTQWKHSTGDPAAMGGRAVVRHAGGNRADERRDRTRRWYPGSPAVPWAQEGRVVTLALVQLLTAGGRWADQAACVGDLTRASWWDLPDGNEPLSPENQLAQAICGGCEVRAECLTRALADGDRGVIRGGEALRTTAETVVCPCGTRFVRPLRRGNRRKYCSTRCARAAMSAAGRRGADATNSLREAA